MGRTCICYSPELQEAIVERVYKQQLQATRPLSLRTVLPGDRPIPASYSEPEAQDKAFRALHARMSPEMTYHMVVQGAVAVLDDQVAEVLVSCAWAASEEGAEMSEDRSTLSLRVLPDRFADPLGLKRFLRHELGRVTDILDLTFGYGASLPEGPTVTHALRRRFSLLWDCSIDGRITRTGGPPMHAREEYEAECVRLFPGLPRDVAEAAVGQLWEGERPPYRSLVHMAAELAALAPRTGGPLATGSGRLQDER